MIRKGKSAAGAAKAEVRRQQQKAERQQAEQTNEMNHQLAAQAEKITALQAQVAQLRAENEQAILREIAREDEVRALKNEVARLRRLVPPEERGEVVETETVQPVEPEPTDVAAAPEAVQALCAQFNIYVVGGSQTWQKRVAAVCPALKVIGSQKNFDAQQLQYADLLVLNTNFVSHACINKAKEAAPRTTRVRFLSQNQLSALYALITETFSLSL